MSKTHFITNYHFPDNGDIDFVTFCGLRRAKMKHFVDGSILADRINCKTCRKILSKIAKPIILLLLISSCSIADKLERSHNVLWLQTKALRVKATGDPVILESFSNPARTYEYKASGLHVGDTVLLNDSIRIKLKIKRIQY